MHKIVTESKPWRGFISDTEKAKAAAATQTAEADERLQAYNEGLRLAVEKGTTPPPPPPITHQHIDNVLRVELNHIETARRDWVTANLSDLFAAVYEREDAILARSAELIAELEALAAEEGTLLGTLRHLHHQAGNIGTISGAGTSFECLVRAAKTGTRLLREPLMVAVQRL